MKNERGIIMKRLLCVLLILCLVPVFALADFDLSSMSFSDLQTLQNEINREIRNRPEWKSVSVPSGIYTVGAQIPAGSYSVSGDGFYIAVYRDNSLIVNQGVTSEDDFIAHIELMDGDTVKIQYGNAVFAPPVALGF